MSEQNIDTSFEFTIETNVDLTNIDMLVDRLGKARTSLTNLKDEAKGTVGEFASVNQIDNALTMINETIGSARELDRRRTELGSRRNSMSEQNIAGMEAKIERLENIVSHGTDSVMRLGSMITSKDNALSTSHIKDLLSSLDENEAKALKQYETELVSAVTQIVGRRNQIAKQIGSRGVAPVARDIVSIAYGRGDDPAMESLDLSAIIGKNGKGGALGRITSSSSKQAKILSAYMAAAVNAEHTKEFKNTVAGTRQPIILKDVDEYSSIEQLLKNNASAFAGAYEGKGFNQSMINAALKRAGVKKTTKLGADTYAKLVNEISSSIGSQGNSALLSAMLESGFASRSSNGTISLNKGLTVNDIATKLMPAMWSDYIKRVGGLKKDSLDVDDKTVSVYDYEAALNNFNKDAPDKDKLRNKLLSRTNSSGGAGSSFAGLSFLSGLLDDIKNDSGAEVTEANRVVEHAAKIAKDVYKIRSYAPFRGKGIDTETTINESQVTRLLGHGHKDNYNFLDDIMELSTEGMTAKDSEKYMEILDQLEKEGWSRITFHGTGENNVTRFIKTEAKERIEKQFEPLKKRWEEKYGNGQLMGSVFENFISAQMLGVDSQKIFKNFDAINKGWTDTVDYAGIGEKNAKLLEQDPTGEKLMKAAMKRVGTVTPRLAIVSMKNLAKEAKANDVDFEYSNGLGYLSDAFAPAGMQARGAMGIKGSFMASGFSDMFDMLTQGLGLKAEQDKTGDYVNVPTVGGGTIKIRKGKYQGLVDESMIKNGAAWYSAKNMEKASEELSEFLAYTGLSYAADYGDDSDATRLGTQMSRMIKWSKPVSDKYAAEVEERIRAVQTLAGAKKYIFTDPKNDPLAAKLWSDEGEEYFAQDIRGEVRMRQQRYIDSLRESVAHNDFLSLSPSDGSMFADSRIENKRLITNPLMGLLASGAMTKRGATSADDVQQATNDALAKVVEAYKSMNEGIVGDNFKDLQNEANIFSKAYDTLKATMAKAGIENLTPEEAMGIISLQGFGTKGSGRFLDKGYIDLANKDFAFNAFSRSPTGMGQVLARVNYASIVEGVLKDLKLTGAAKEGVMLSYGDMEWLQGADMDADSVKLITDAKYLLGKNKEGKSNPDYIKKLINGELDSLRSDTSNTTVVDDIAKTYAEIEDMFSGTSILKKIKEAVDAQVEKSTALVRYDKNGNTVPLTAEEVAAYDPKSKEAFAQGTIQAIETTQKMGLGSAIAARLSSVGDVGAMQKILAEIGLQGNSLYDAATTNQKRAVTLSLTPDQMQALSLGAEYSKSFKLFSSLTGAQKNEEIEALNAGEDKHFAFINTPGSHRPEFISLDGMMARKSNGGFAIDQTNLRSFGNAADVQSAIALANIPITAGTKTSLDLYKKVLLDEAQYEKDESGNYVFDEDGMLKYAETTKDEHGKWTGTHSIGFGITDALAARGFDTKGMKDLQVALRTYQAEEGLIRGGLTMNEKEGLINLTGAARESAGRIALEMFADYFGTDIQGAKQFAGTPNSLITTGIGVLDQNGPMSYETLVNKLFTMVGGHQGELATGTRQIKIGGQDLNITSGGDIGTFLTSLAKQNGGVFTKADLELASKAFRLENNELFEYVSGGLTADRLRERVGELPEPVKRALELYKDTLNEVAKAKKAEAEATNKATKATEEAAKIEEAAAETRKEEAKEEKSEKHGTPSSAYTHQDDYDFEESEAHAGPIKNDTVEYKGEEAAEFLLNMMKQAAAPEAPEPPIPTEPPFIPVAPAGVAAPDDALTFSRYKFKESVGGVLEDANILMSGLNKDIFATDERTSAEKYYYGQNNTVKTILKKYEELAKQAAEDKSLENDPEFLALTDIIRGRDIFAEDGTRLGNTETIYQKLASGNRARLRNKAESTDAAIGRKSLRDTNLDNMFKSYDDVDNIIKEQESEIEQYKAQILERKEELLKNTARTARDGRTFSEEELAQNVDRQYDATYSQVEYSIGADGKLHSKVVSASKADEKVVKESEAKLEEFKKRRDEIQKELRLSIKETINHSIDDLSRMSGIITQEDDTKDTVEQQLIAFKKKLVGLRESFDKEKLKALGMSDEDIAALETRLKANEEAYDNGSVKARIESLVENKKALDARRKVNNITKAQFASDDILRELNGGTLTPEEIAKNARIAMEERMTNMYNDYLTKAQEDIANADEYKRLAEAVNPLSPKNKDSLDNYEKKKFGEAQKRDEIAEAQKQWDIDRLGRSYGQNDLQLARLNRTGFRASNDILSRGIESSFNLRDQYNYIINAYQAEQSEIKTRQSALDPEKDKALYQAYEQRLTMVKQKQDQAAKSADFYGSTLGKVAGVAASVSASLDQLINRLARQMFQRAIAEAKKFVQEYDAVMTEIAMITTNADGEVSQSMDDISESIINTGKKLKTGFVDTGKVYAALFRQGLDLSQVESSAETIMKYSRVTGVDATAATKQLTTAVKTGLTGSLQEASDVLVALGDSAATTAGEIAAGMQKAAASAKTVGVSYNELAALITIGTERTQLSGTSIGTSLNTIFQRIQKVTKEGYISGEGDENATINDVDQALKNAGLEGVRDGESGFKSATEVLTEISAAWNYLTDLQKQSITYAVAGTRQANIFQTLMSAISDESFDGKNLQELLDIAQFSGGITDAKFATGLNSIASGLANIKNIWDEFLASAKAGEAFKNLIDTASTALTGVTKVLGALGSWDPDVIITGILGITTAFSGLSAVLKITFGGIEGKITGIMQLASTLLAVVGVGTVYGIGKAERKKEITPVDTYKEDSSKAEEVQAEVEKLKYIRDQWKKTGEEINKVQYDQAIKSLNALKDVFPELSNVITGATKDLDSFNEAVDKAEVASKRMSDSAIGNLIDSTFELDLGAGNEDADATYYFKHHIQDFDDWYNGLDPSTKMSMVPTFSSEEEQVEYWLNSFNGKNFYNLMPSMDDNWRAAVQKSRAEDAWNDILKLGETTGYKEYIESFKDDYDAIVSKYPDSSPASRATFFLRSIGMYNPSQIDMDKWQYEQDVANGNTAYTFYAPNGQEVKFNKVDDSIEEGYYRALKYNMDNQRVGYAPLEWYNYYDNLASIYTPNGASLYHDVAQDISDYKYNRSESEQGYINQWRYLAKMAGNVESLNDFYQAIGGYESNNTLQNDEWLKKVATGDWSQMQEYIFGKAGVSFRAPSELVSSALSSNLDKYIVDRINRYDLNSIYASDTAYDRFLDLAGVTREQYQKADSETKQQYWTNVQSRAEKGIRASEIDIGSYLTDIANTFLYDTQTFTDRQGKVHEIKGALEDTKDINKVNENVVEVLRQQFSMLDSIIGDEYQAYIDSLVAQGYKLEWVANEYGEITGISAAFEGVEDNYLDEYISSFTKLARERTVSNMNLDEYLQSKSTTLLEGLDEDVMGAIDAYFTALQGYEQTKSIGDLNDVYKYQREMENKIAEASARYYVDLGRATERAVEWTTALAKTGNTNTDRNNLVNWEYSRLNEINSAAMLAGVDVGTMTEQQKRDYIEKLGFDSAGKYGDELTAMAEDVQNVAYQNWELLMKDYRTVLESVDATTGMEIRSFMDSNSFDDTVEEVYGVINDAFEDLIKSYAETFSDAEANQRNRNDFIDAIRNGETIGSNWNDFLAGDTDFAAAYSAFANDKIDVHQLISTLLGFDETNKFLSSSSERSGGLRSLFDLGFAGGLEGLMSGNAGLNTDWISENQYGLGDKFVGMLGQLGYDNAESLAGASPEQIKLLAAEVENLLMAEEGLFSADMMKKRQDYFSTMAKGGTALVKAEAEAVKQVGGLQDAYAAVYKAQQVGSKALGKIKSGEDSEMDNLVEILKVNGIDGARLEEITGTEAAGIAQRYVEALNQDIRSDLEAMGGLFDMEDIEVALPGITISANSAAPTTVGIDEAIAVARQTGNDLLYAELQEVKRLQGEIKLDLWTEGDKVKARYGDIILEGSAGSTKARSSGGGGGKSAADKLIEQQKRRFEVLDHRIKMVKFDETMYQNRGELTNYGTMLEYENEEQLRYADELEKAIGAIDAQIKKTTKNSDDWWKLVEQRANYEEKIRETSNAIEENTKKIKENQEAVRQTRIKLEDDLDKEVKARIQRERDMLNSTVDMQDIILDAIKQRFRDEWALVEEDIAKKKDALEEEKNLISERLNARKEAADTSSKYEEMVNLQTQLALIEMDSTRTREAAELRKKLADIQEELAWDSAEKEAQYLMDGLDQQSAAYDRYLEDGSEKLDAYLDDNNNFSEEVASILSGSQEDVMNWLTNNVKEYAKITDEAQKQMVEGWTDSWKAMLGITDTYWEQIDGIINGGKEAYIEYMKESQDYINASDTDKLSKIYEWEKAYDDYLNARKEGATWFHEDEWMDYGSAETSSYEPVTPKQLDEVLHNESKPIPIIVKKGVVEDTSAVGDKVALGMPGVNANNKGLFDDHYMVKAYAEGGPVTYTGPAWVDGTMSNPEYMLNANDFKALKNSIALAKTMFTPDVTRVDMSKYSGGQNIGDVNVVINEATISNDQDIAELAERVGEAFTKSISNNGIYTTKYNF